MLPDQVSNPGPLTYESGALPIALRGPATCIIGMSLKGDKVLATSFVCIVSLELMGGVFHDISAWFNN